MKFLGLLTFAIALKWTWSMAICEPAVDVRTHTQVQQELRTIITNVITQLRPSATELKFGSIWTEQLNDNQLRAHFSYTFKDQAEDGQDVEQSEEGFGVLNRMGESGDPTTNSWSLDEVTISQEVVDFKKGIVIKPTEK